MCVRRRQSLTGWAKTSFLALYGFGRARAYLLIVDGKSYDSKAILGVAFGLATGRRWARRSSAAALRARLVYCAIWVSRYVTYATDSHRGRAPLQGVAGPVDLRRRRYRKLLRAKLAEEVDEMLATDDADAPGETGRRPRGRSRRCQGPGPPALSAADHDRQPRHLRP